LTDGDSVNENFFSLGRSPLWMVSQDRDLNEFVTYLQKVRELLKEEGSVVTLTFNRAEVERVQQSFAAMIRKGEEALHRIALLVCSVLGDGGDVRELVEISSVVIGGIPTTRERFTLSQVLDPDALYDTTDLDLGTRQLRKLRYFDGNKWVVPTLVSNVVEYQPRSFNGFNVHKFMTRVKAEEEIWNKVADEIFELDSLVARDKQLSHLSRYVKDVFGLKAVVSDEQSAFKLLAELERREWSADTLRSVGVVPSPETQRFSLLETKDYLSGERGKNSGWQALKVVVTWGGRPFEVQIQTLRNYLRERERLTQESHASFKATREDVRNRIAEQLPLFGFFRDLLRWLFLAEGALMPEHPSVRIVLEENGEVVDRV
jgi:hypothetical protein